MSTTEHTFPEAHVGCGEDGSYFVSIPDSQGDGSIVATITASQVEWLAKRAGWRPAPSDDTSPELQDYVTGLADWLEVVAEGKVEISETDEPRYVGDMFTPDPTYTLIDWVNDQFAFNPAGTFDPATHSWDLTGVVVQVSAGGRSVWVDTSAGTEGVHASDLDGSRAFAPLSDYVLDELDALARFFVGEA